MLLTLLMPLVMAILSLAFITHYEGHGSENWASEECQVCRLEGQPSLCPFAVETSSVLGQTALSLVWDIGQCLHQATGEERSKEYLLQRVPIAVQRGNAAAVLGTVGRWEDPFWGWLRGTLPPLLLFYVFILRSSYYYPNTGQFYILSLNVVR